MVTTTDMTGTDPSVAKFDARDRSTIVLLCVVLLFVVVLFFLFIYWQGLTSFPATRLDAAVTAGKFDYFAYALEYRERRLTLALTLRTFITSLSFVVGLVLAVIGGIFILRRAAIDFNASSLWPGSFAAMQSLQQQVQAAAAASRTAADVAAANAAAAADALAANAAAANAANQANAAQEQAAQPPVADDANEEAGDGNGMQPGAQNAREDAIVTPVIAQVPDRSAASPSAPTPSSQASFAIATNSPGVIFLLGGVLIIYLTQLLSIQIGAPEIFPQNAAVMCDRSQQANGTCYVDRNANSSGPDGITILQSYCTQAPAAAGCKDLQSLLNATGTAKRGVAK